MWGSTEKLAKAIENAFEEKNIEVQMAHLGTRHISDIMTQLLCAEYICVGSPTLNNGMLPTVAAFLTYMKGLAPKNRKALAFGSYGWGGQSIGQIDEILKSCGFEMMEPVKAEYIPAESVLESVKEKVKEAIS
jgi:flavorubredoxin